MNIKSGQVKKKWGNSKMILIIKYFMLFLLLVACTLIGRFLSKKYVYRLNELEEIKNGLNIFESKIKFTYDPIPEIFEEISKRLSLNVSNIFITAKEKMKEITNQLIEGLFLKPTIFSIILGIAIILIIIKIIRKLIKKINF